MHWTDQKYGLVTIGTGISLIFDRGQPFVVNYDVRSAWSGNERRSETRECGETVSDRDVKTCAFSLDVDEWYAEREERRAEWDEGQDAEREDADRWEFEERFLEDGEWCCYRRTRPEEEYCLFHAHESEAAIGDDIEPGQVLRDIVNATTEHRLWNEGMDGIWEVPRHPPGRDEPFDRDEHKRREKQFVGSSLGDVALSHEDLDGPDSYPIDLRLAKAESLDLSRSRVSHRLLLYGFEQQADLGDDDHGIDFYKTRIEGTLGLNDLVSMGGVRLEELRADVVGLDRAVVHGDISAAFLDAKGVYLENARVIDGDLLLPVVSSSESVRLPGAHVDGDVSLDRVDVDHRISLSDARVGGDVHLENAETGRSVRLEDADIGGKVSITQASIGTDVVFETAAIGGIEIQYTDIGGTVTLDHAQVGSDSLEEETSVELRSAEIGGMLQLIFAELEGRMTVIGTTVADASRKGGAEFGGDYWKTVIAGSRFRGLVRIEDTELNGNVFSHARFDESVRIEDAVVGGQFLFTGWQTGGSVSVIETKITDAMRFPTKSKSTYVIHCASKTAYIDATADCLEIGGRLNLRGIDVPELTLDCTLTHPAVGVVSLERATIGSATLAVTLQADDSIPVYELEHATVGDIVLDDDGSNESSDGGGFVADMLPKLGVYESSREQKAFEELRFLGTTFDGFVFSEKRERFRETDWQAHRPRDGGYEDIAIVTQSLETSGNLNDIVFAQDNLNGVVFEVARDIAEAASGIAIVEALQPSTGENTDTESGQGMLPDTKDTAAAVVTTYLEDEFESPDPDGPPSGDPFSFCARFRRSSPDPQHDPSGEWRQVAEARIDELEEVVGAQLNCKRTRRASWLSYSATTRADTLEEMLHDAIRDATADDPPGVHPTGIHVPNAPVGPAPAGSLPKQFDTDPGSTPNADRLAEAVLRTLALEPAIAADLAAKPVETARDRAGGRTVDGGVPAPVATLCETWDVTTGTEATAFERAVVQALADAGAPIVEAATAIREDHRRLAEVGLAAEMASMNEDDFDGPNPCGAIADAILEYEAVSDAEFAAAELRKDEPRYRRLCDRLGIPLEGVEEAVARDLADYRTAMGTNNELESTYALAKNGASEAGDETAAGNFFQREAGYARRQHWHRLGGPPAVLQLLFAVALAVGALAYGIPDTIALLSRPRLGRLLVPVLSLAVALVSLSTVRQELGQFLKWAGNVFLWLTMGYGEKPARVLAFSAAIVGVFALAYRSLGAAVTPTAGSVDLGYLVFSLGSFVTLVLGNPSAERQVVRLLAVLEGFIGVFVIGMFVVAVTRAVHR